jgi:hypothetical protein
MYYNLVNSMKRRLVLELQDCFSRHPVYNKIAPNIQNRFVFKERPQYAIVVKGSSTNKVQLSADNFMGTIESHVMLAQVGPAVFPLEWVREDLDAVQRNGNRMPVLPGVYYIEILSAPTNASEQGYYVIDPLITVSDEALLRLESGIEADAQLQQVPVRKTLRIWENRRYLLTEGRDYSVNYKSGAVSLSSTFNEDTELTADYRYAVPSIGPVPFQWNTSDSTTLPGVVLAFGKRAQKGDKVAVVVYPDRVATANAYGGRFDLSFELDVIAGDPYQAEEIADLSTMYMWSERRPHLSSEGIELVDVSMGGEAEEAQDETADIPVYTASMSMQFQVDWEVHIPLTLTISKVTPTKLALDGTEVPSIEAVDSSLFFATSPIAAGRNNDFERIK